MKLEKGRFGAEAKIKKNNKVGMEEMKGWRENKYQD